MFEGRRIWVSQLKKKAKFNIIDPWFLGRWNQIETYNIGFLVFRTSDSDWIAPPISLVLQILADGCGASWPPYFFLVNVNISYCFCLSWFYVSFKSTNNVTLYSFMLYTCPNLLPDRNSRTDFCNKHLFGAWNLFFHRINFSHDGCLLDKWPCSAILVSDAKACVYLL